jgi:membrane protein
MIHNWMRQARSVIIETMIKWDRDNVSRLAAALSCYTLLSIAPLGILLVAGAGIVFGERAARGQVAVAMGPVIGSEVARAMAS